MVNKQTYYSNDIEPGCRDSNVLYAESALPDANIKNA